MGARAKQPAERPSAVRILAALGWALAGLSLAYLLGATLVYASGMIAAGVGP